MSLSSEEIERYARHIVLHGLGGPGQQKLKAAKVLVIGAGMAGLSAARLLADAGHVVTLIEARDRIGGFPAGSRDGKGQHTVHPPWSVAGTGTA